MNTSLKWLITASFIDCDHIDGTATRSVDVPFYDQGHCRRNGDLASWLEQVYREFRLGSPIQMNRFRCL